MNRRPSFHWKPRLSLLCLATLLLSLSVFFSCKKTVPSSVANPQTALRQVLYLQSLYNNHPGEDIVPQISEVIDSMRIAGPSPYYFAAVNVLIDRLFSDGRFAEADSLAVKMEREAKEGNDSVSLAMAHRVRAQMFYKLSQPSRAWDELSISDDYIPNPYRSCSDFGTATSLQEWKWIIAAELGDTVGMNKAGLIFAQLVENNMDINQWTDSTGHYPASALAFKAQDALSNGNYTLSQSYLDSASSFIIPELPARAYEHLYLVRAKARCVASDWDGALEDVNILLDTHKDFPWFYVHDLLLKAQILDQAGKHAESSDAFARYIQFHDSLNNNITEKRLDDLTVLYRSEINHEQRRANGFKIIGLCVAIILLLILLGVSYYHMKRERKKNLLLVQQLKESDKINPLEISEAELSPVERLEHYMLTERPYTDPAMGRKELAEYLGINQEAVGLLIKKEKGMSVHSFINSFRLEETRKILGSGSSEGIAEIAVRLGFGTARTLQRAFKERYDMSPTQYRDTASHLK